MTKRNEFIQEFNALLKKYKAELTVREVSWAMQSIADGIDIEFDWDEKEGIIESIQCGTIVSEIE